MNEANSLVVIVRSEQDLLLVPLHRFPHVLGEVDVAVRSRSLPAAYFFFSKRADRFATTPSDVWPLPSRSTFSGLL